MNPLRLVLVTERFWPLVGGAETVMANLAVELIRRGRRVTVATSRWDPSWPSSISYKDVPVVRLAHRPAEGVKSVRYVRALSRWLSEHQEQFDLVCVSGLKYEAYAAVRALGRNTPVVLRAERAGRFGDCVWQLDATCGRRIKRQCLKADALVGAGPAAEQELKAAGYPRTRIHRIDNGVSLPPGRAPASKTAARAMLAEAHSMLNLPPSAPLAVYTGRLDERRGLRPLIVAWERIVARWPNARVWLAGEGPYKKTLIRQIEASNLTGRAVPVGVFDHVDALLAAADLYVLPIPEATSNVALLEAMAAGLPIVVGDLPGARAVIRNENDGLVVPAGDPWALAAAIRRVLDEPDLSARLAAAACQRAVDEFSLEKMVDRHLALFESLVHENATVSQP